MSAAAITLDAAGTLLAPAEPIGVTYARTAARHAIHVSPDDVARGFAAAFAAAPPLAFPDATDAADRAARERAWWAAIVAAALGRGAPPGAVDAVFDELYARYARPEAWRVYADVPPALAALRARGTRLAVVSNFDGRLPGLLAGLGLAPYLDAVVWSSLAGAAKPAPAIFRAALTALNARPTDALHAGDSVAADVEGARAAGMAAVLVDRERRSPPLPPDVRVVESLAALVQP
jgi:putative hydrolase of the HAD superfamily